MGGKSCCKRAGSALSQYDSNRNQFVALVLLSLCVLTAPAVVWLVAGAAPRMFLSAATLVIVPVTLIPHWQQQVGIMDDKAAAAAAAAAARVCT
jgi:hypothetical protein